MKTFGVEDVLPTYRLYHFRMISGISRLLLKQEHCGFRNPTFLRLYRLNHHVFDMFCNFELSSKIRNSEFFNRVSNNSTVAITVKTSVASYSVFLHRIEQCIHIFDNVHRFRDVPQLLFFNS